MIDTRILVADDELGLRFALCEYLRLKGFAVSEAESCAAAEATFRKQRPDIVLLDNFLSDGTALDLLPRLKAIDASVPIIVLTAQASIHLAVSCIKQGAEQFLTKPLDLRALEVILERLIEAQRIQRLQAATRAAKQRTPDPFYGTSAAIQRLREQASLVAGAGSSIVIHGETGAGKGVLARWLHDHSARANEPFVDLNCAGLSKDFLETELFGHEKGAFTSAVATKPGLLEMAHKGTLFLDEIGDMDPSVQPKLLKVLEEQRFRRLGDVKDRSVDIRLIAASHHDLGALAQLGKFRSDLYFRVNTIPLKVPALRDRREDIPLLAEQFLAQLCAELGRPGKVLSSEALTSLRQYWWPGNVRELRNVLERAVLLHKGDTILPEHLLFDRAHSSENTRSDTDLTLEQLERLHIEEALKAERGNVPNAARRLGIPRSSLYQRLKKFDIAFGRSNDDGNIVTIRA